ncbi:MAG TPA: carbonic anhydrase [Jiangellales bacterium]|nr:carbonic anhydrase [Jiangellales bacterium]
MTDFDDVLAANARYAEDFELGGLDAVARAGLAIVTCMDSRIDPLHMVGLGPGDVKILRNAGARVTDDVLRTLVLATHLLGVDRVMVVPHTNCKMASATQEQIVEVIRDASGVDAHSLDFGVVHDQRATLLADVERIKHWPFLPPGVQVGGFVYDVRSGRLEHVV